MATPDSTGGLIARHHTRIVADSAALASVGAADFMPTISIYIAEKSRLVTRENDFGAPGGPATSGGVGAVGARNRTG
jgi:hypothetical protein